MNISTWNGTLSSSDFFIAARALCEKWQVMNPVHPPWTWVPYSRPFMAGSREVDGYLSINNLYCFKSNKEEDENIVSPDNESDGSRNEERVDNVTAEEDEGVSSSEGNSYGDEELLDSATMVPSDDRKLYSYDFTIVYSTSYKVPVLYFCGYRSDGQLLSLDEIEEGLSPNSLKILKESKWTFMTQEEHPYLNRPWYTLHPCGTSEWMKLLFQGDDSVTKHNNDEFSRLIQQHYLVSWLSVVSQVFGLRVPPEMLRR